MGTSETGHELNWDFADEAAARLMVERLVKGQHRRERAAYHGGPTPGGRRASSEPRARVDCRVEHRRRFQRRGSRGAGIASGGGLRLRDGQDPLARHGRG